jgi:hypothetical protein
MLTGKWFLPPDGHQAATTTTTAISAFAAFRAGSRPTPLVQYFHTRGKLACKQSKNDAKTPSSIEGTFYWRLNPTQRPLLIQQMLRGDTARYSRAPTRLSNRIYIAALHKSAYVQVFGRRQRRSNHSLRRPASEKRQGTKSRGGVVRRRRRRRYGKAGRFATAIRLDRQHNLDVTARILLNGEFTFCPTHDFNELSVAKKHTRQLLRDGLHDKLWTAA